MYYRIDDRILGENGLPIPLDKHDVRERVMVKIWKPFTKARAILYRGKYVQGR